MSFNAAKTLRRERERKFILADFYQFFYGKTRYDLLGGGVTLDISVVLKFLKCVLNLSYLRNLLDFLICSSYNILCNKICAKYIKMLQQECDLFFFFFSIKTDCDFIKVDNSNRKLLLLVNFWSIYRKKRFISNRRLSKLEKWHSVKWFSQISWTDKFPAIVGNYSTQKAPLQFDRIQPILV